MNFLTRSRIVVLLILASALVITPGIRAQDDAAKVLPEMEKALWAAWAKADLATFQWENTRDDAAGTPVPSPRY